MKWRGPQRHHGPQQLASSASALAKGTRPHQFPTVLVKAPIVLVWDRLNTHVSRAMSELIAERAWLT
ncbi:hypothetical protein ABT050_39250, partial [Streptomyces mirabilis]